MSSIIYIMSDALRGLLEKKIVISMGY